MRRSAILRVNLLTLFMSGGVPAALADSAPPALAALSTIQPGAWILKARDGQIPPRTLCLGDPRALLQIRHGSVPCSRFVIANDPAQTVVHYTCPGAGHGRTTIRVETARLIQIESQGIADNAPFDWTIEGRRVGECAAASAQR